MKINKVNMISAGFEPEVDWKAICQFLEYCKDWNFIDSYMKSQK